MALPLGPQISILDFNTILGNGSNAMNWLYIKNNTKPGQESNAMSSYYGKDWYQRNVDGNCNNGNCNCNCNCGDTQCINCALAAINCANCDTRAWIQNCTGNYNCACTYNCTQQAVYTYNCANCACGGNCY